MKSKYFLRAVSLLVLLVSLIPASNAGALPLADPPPANMFQLPWDLGIAWVAIDGLDNGTRRPMNSSHHYTVGGAIDFAPHNNMKMGEDTSRFWVAAAASGTVIAKSFCHVKIDHGNGWTTEYQFLANVQVKVGDSVSRNQRLGIIADGFRQPFCPGSQDPNVPHVHFMLRPSLRDAALAGWEVNYLSVLNKTTFRKNDQTVGLFKPLLNVFDSQPTPTPTPQPTNTPGLTPSSTPTPMMSATPTLSGPYVSTTVDPASIEVGETALVTIRLNNVPSGGYLSAEFTCHYDPSLLEVSNITVANLFGTDPVTAMNGPQNGKFILAIAGSNGNKATIDGTVFTFNVKGLYPGQTFFGCEARVSEGSNVLTQIPSARVFLTVLGSTPTPNLTPSTPTVLPSTCDRAEFIADVNIPPGTVMLPGAQFTKTWRLKNIGPCDWTTSYGLVFFSGEQMGAVSSTSFTQNVAVGQTVDISINMTAPNAPGSYRGYWMFRNSSGANFGIGPEAKEPWFVEIIVAGPTLPPSLTPTYPPSSSTPTPTTSGPGNSPTPSITPGAPTVTPTLTASPTIPVGEWLSFTNNTYGFRFLYPPGGQIVAAGNDNSTRITLPFVPGTNLSEKYLQMTVVENANPCRSPLATSSIPQTSETVVINGISFLKETGEDGTAGHINKWTAYSTMKDNACVSLDFVLRAANPGVFQTPPPLYDEAAESLVFGQIVSTYQWLEGPVTSTPTPAESATPTATQSTPMASPTPTALTDGTLTGQVFASKPVTVSLYDAADVLVTSVTASPDGSFSLTAPAGTYTITASASGYLDAEGPATITAGGTTAKPALSLLAGDIDGNDVIDPFDALTIGMSYNATTPPEADLNSDGVINVLDLELLAGNYRKSGPQNWD